MDSPHSKVSKFQSLPMILVAHPCHWILMVGVSHPVSSRWWLFKYFSCGSQPWCFHQRPGSAYFTWAESGPAALESMRTSGAECIWVRWSLKLLTHEWLMRLMSLMSLVHVPWTPTDGTWDTKDAAVNVNIWLTPDQACRRGGGLDIYRSSPHRRQRPSENGGVTWSDFSAKPGPYLLLVHGLGTTIAYLPRVLWDLWDLWDSMIFGPWEPQNPMAPRPFPHRNRNFGGLRHFCCKFWWFPNVEDPQ